MNDIAPDALHDAIIEQLKTVIDPETNVDVVRMRLIEDLRVDEDRVVHYTFRPSSPVCPIAFMLAAQIKRTVAGVPGVAGQRILIKDYVAAEGLMELLKELEDVVG